MTRSEARRLALQSAFHLILAHLESGGVLPQGDAPAVEWASADYRAIERELRQLAVDLGRRGGLDG